MKKELILKKIESNTEQDFNASLPTSEGPKVLRQFAESALANSLGSLNRTRLDSRLEEFQKYRALDQDYHIKLRREADRKLTRFLSHTTSRARAFGAVCGVFGWVGQVAELPLFYVQAFKNVAEVALLYGYDPRDESEQVCLLSILEAAHLPTHTLRKKAVDKLLASESKKADQMAFTFLAAAAGRTLVQKARTSLPKKIRLATPLVGALFGGMYSANLMENVIKTAQLFYRGRLQIEEDNA